VLEPCTVDDERGSGEIADEHGRTMA
jgi:hypothetical protein